MKMFRYLAILATVICAAACVQTDVDMPVEVNNGKTIQVVAHVASFSDKDVSSRALKVGDESRVKALCFVVFNPQGVCTRKEYQTNTQPITLSTDDLGNGYTLCMFANIENPSLGQGNTMNEFFSQISCPVSSVDIPDFGGEKCFPMYGEKKIDGALEAVIQIPLVAMYAKVVVNILSKPDQTIVGNAPASFSLTKFEVHNVVESVDFVGLPEGGKISDKGKNNGYSDKTEVANAVYSSRNITSDFAQADKEASFYFYLPERFLAAEVAADDYDYPFGKASAGTIRPEDEKYRQGYKPCLVENNDPPATFVRFFGEYIDHQGHNWNVSYDIYVGNDNYSNFDVERNVQYNNYVTIKGISKSNDQTQNENSISIDHRVDVSRVNPVIINLRRETLLDSHFEVRPLRIRKNVEFKGEDLSKAKVRVEVIYAQDDATKNWIGIERSFGNGVTQTASNSTYLVANDLLANRKNAAGKRKYFTTNLTQSLTSTNSKTTEGNQYIDIPITEAGETMWIYVDECTATGDDVRSAKIRVTVSFDGTNFPVEQSTEYIINQRKLFPVATTRNASDDGAGGAYTYYIEYHEEYLHNYDVEDSYGQTEHEGMEWGLNNIQLSNKYPAIYLEGEGSNIFDGWSGSNVKDLVNASLKSSNIDPKYDFYLKRDNVHSSLTVRYFDGFNMCDDIKTYILSTYGSHQQENEDDDDVSAKINYITLAQDPKSAYAYCYNKNKRNDKGEVENIEWYLPAIDEIEDIVESAHARFEEFQDKLYWSCQPAYLPHDLFVTRWNWYIIVGWGDHSSSDGQYSGTYYIDDTNRARATKAVRVWSEEKNDYIFVGAESAADAYLSYNNAIFYLSNSSMSGSKNKTVELGSPTLNTDRKDFEGNLPRTNTKARVRCVRKVN